MLDTPVLAGTPPHGVARSGGLFEVCIVALQQFLRLSWVRHVGMVGTWFERRLDFMAAQKQLQALQVMPRDLPRLTIATYLW